MGRLSGSRVAAAIGASCLLVAMTTPAAAESALWSLTASPLAVTTGTATTFTLQATNEDPLAATLSSSEIGCLHVDVPTNFTVASAAVAASSAGSGWTAGVTGNKVRVWTTSGGDRLETLDWVRFTIGATAWSTGSLAWNARAFRQSDCTGTGTLLTVPPVVLVSGGSATPTPAPTATQAPTSTLAPAPPTPTPTARPTAAPTAPPTPALSLPAAPSSTPALASTPATSAGGAGPDEPSSAGTEASPSVPTDSSPDQGDLALGRGGQPTPTAIRLDAARLELGGARIGLLDDIQLWLVPAASIAVPGLLILLWIALQAVGAAAWLPVVRRFRGEPEDPAAPAAR